MTDVRDGGVTAPGTGPRDSSPMRGWRALPWLVLAGGAAFAAWLLWHVRPGIFYSGDGGVKFLFVQQFARGELAADLRLQGEPWVKALWSAGHYPFDWPFTFPVDERIFAWCPLPFEYLAAPPYALFGWRGLYFWPVVGLATLWLMLLRLCRRLAVGPGWTALALFSVIFCSPITIYGAMYWEHSLGVAVALSGLSLLVAPALRAPTRNGLLAGFVLGFAVWLRSELVWLTAVAAAMLPVAGLLGVELRGRRAFFAGLAAAGLGFLAWNALLYGDPLGMTSKPLVGGVSGPLSRAQGISWIFPALLEDLAHFGPAVALAGVAGLLLLVLRLGDGAARGQARLWMLLAAAYVLGVVLVLPNVGGNGGKQFGPRYLLVAFPLAAIVLAIAGRSLWDRAGPWGRAAIGVALALGLGAGVRVNAVDGARDLTDDYEFRIAPPLAALRADPAEVVVATNPFISQELTSLFGSKRFFRARDGADLARLAFSLASVGQARFIVLGDFGPLSLDVPGAVWDRKALLQVRPMGCYGSLGWCLNEARVAPVTPTR